MLRSLVSCAALAAATLTLSVPAVHAQNGHYDGYCYVRSDDMAADAGSASCLRGEYYVYTDGYRPAPRAPQGYQVEYFTHRPDRDIYSQVYNASTLTANFDPGARNHFGKGGDQYASSTDSGRYDGNPDNQDMQPGAVTQDDRVTGWRDDGGNWHQGQPAALGWRDEAGHWHVGQVAAYGWQDDQGNWHDKAQDSGN